MLSFFSASGVAYKDCLGMPGIPETACEAAKSTVKLTVPGGPVLVKGGETAATVRDVASDPLGYLADKAQGAAQGLAESVLPSLVRALQPDLTAKWFITAYQGTFAIALLVWVLLLLWNLYLYSRRQIGGDEIFDVLTRRSVVFLLGCMFGPPLGAFVVKLVGALTQGVIGFFLFGKSADGLAKSVSDLMSGPTHEMVGGALVALIVYTAMTLGLLFVLVTLVITLVTLYFSGVVFPLGWVWYTDATSRHRSTKILRLWAGVLASQPLMFIMLGASLAIAGGGLSGATSVTGLSEGMRALMGLCVAVVALWMTAFTPALMVRFAPVGPTDGETSGVTGSMPRLSETGRGSSGGSGLGQLSSGGMSGGGAPVPSPGVASGGQALSQAVSGGGSGGSMTGGPSGGGLGLGSLSGGAMSGASGGAAGSASAGGTAAGARAGAALGPAGAAAGAAAGSAARGVSGALSGAVSGAAHGGGSPGGPGSSGSQSTGTGSAGSGPGGGGSGPGTGRLPATAPTGGGGGKPSSQGQGGQGRSGVARKVNKASSFMERMTQVALEQGDHYRRPPHSGGGH